MRGNDKKTIIEIGFESHVPMDGLFEKMKEHMGKADIILAEADAKEVRINKKEFRGSYDPRMQEYGRKLDEALTEMIQKGKIVEANRMRGASKEEMKKFEELFFSLKPKEEAGFVRIMDETRFRDIFEGIKNGKYRGKRIYIQAGVGHSALLHMTKRAFRGNMEIIVKPAWLEKEAALVKGRTNRVFGPEMQKSRFYRFNVDERYNEGERERINESLGQQVIDFNKRVRIKRNEFQKNGLKREEATVRAEYEVLGEKRWGPKGVRMPWGYASDRKDIIGNRKQNKTGKLRRR